MPKVGPKQTLFSGIFFLLKTGNHAKYLILIIPKMLVENRRLIAKKEKNLKPQKTLTQKTQQVFRSFHAKIRARNYPQNGQIRKNATDDPRRDGFIRRLNRFLQDVFVTAVCL